jgi:hypothetical protein
MATSGTYCCPTAHTSQGVIAVAALSLPATSGLGKTLQLLPSHRPINVKPVTSPTAQASPGDTAATPYRALFSGHGPKTKLQKFPSQCSVKPPVLKLNGFRDHPSAQMSLEPVADTACKKLSPEGLGLETMLHVEPSQCSISVEKPNEAWPQYPTAHTLLGPSATTP